LTPGGGRTLAPFGRRLAPVVAREQYGAYVVLRCRDDAGPRPQAGQFYMLSTATGWGGGAGERPFLPRAFSVLRTPSETNELHFLIEDVGPGTRRLTRTEPGEELALTGPLGHGFTAPAEDRTAVLVGGGVGIAPLAIWQDQLDQLEHPATALLGFRDGPHAAGAILLDHPRIATDDGSVGHHGLVNDPLRETLEDEERECTVYACGPPPMLEATRRLCELHLVPAQLALESGMACGFGACFGCVVPTRRGYVRLCVDGPVLDAGALELVGGTGH
jgi:dihydroorotate dehydrogenase electron transfer subunit